MMSVWLYVPCVGICRYMRIICYVYVIQWLVFLCRYRYLFYISTDVFMTGWYINSGIIYDYTGLGTE